MYEQKTHLNEAVHPNGYVRDMLLRERMNSYRFLAYSQILTFLA
jgi:hypothetical protein